MKKMGYLCFQYITRKEYIPFLSLGPCSHYVVRYHYIDDAHKEEIIDPREETEKQSASRYCMATFLRELVEGYVTIVFQI